MNDSLKNSIRRGILVLSAIGSVVWLDLLYGIGFAMLIPNLIVSVLTGEDLNRRQMPG